jgi:serine/threonine-protein kinase
MSTHPRFQNPFYNRQRITDPAFFYGRASHIEALYSAVVTKQCRSIVGERKLGKSSLLTTIGQPETLRRYGLDPQRQLMLYFDLESMASASVEDFWLEVLDALSVRLPPSAGDLLTAIRRAADYEEVRFMNVRRLLRRVRDAGFDVTLCLDEFESLARNAHFGPDFYGELRSLAGELGLVCLTASKRSLYELTYENSDTLSSPFFNIFSELPLGLMSDEEARTMLARLSSRGGVALCDDEIAFALSLAGTHPFFLQIAGFHLYDTPGCGQPRASEGYQQVRKRFLAEAEDHYRYLWSQLSNTQQLALAHLSQASEPVVHLLKQRALLKNRDEEPAPFSATFAEFLQRQRAEQVAAPMSTTMGDLTGRTLGPYRVLAPLGQGGMAEVYKGYQPSLDRYVALKILTPRSSTDAAFAERFQREATAIAKLRHPNIVQVYDFGTAEGLTYMVMELIGGPTLRDRMSDLRARSQLVPRDEVLTITRDVAAALDYAHAHGLIHRDVKPANILLRLEESPTSDFQPLTSGTQLSTSEPYAVLTDFGVVKMLEGVQFTATGMTLGTPDYMSPEQASGEEVTHLGDVYALGVIVYEMLVGQLPFSSDTPLAVLLMHISDPPPPARTIVPDLPHGVDEVLTRALAKSPRERFPSAGELAAALGSVL